MARQGAQASGPCVLDFVPSAADDDAAVEVAAKLVPAGIVLRRGGAYPALRHAREVVTFLPYLLVGLVPPFSPFFMATLEEYGLTPNVILILALFALFRHFFSLMRSPSLSPVPAPPRNTAPSAMSSLGGVAPASFPLPERTSGRTGSGNGCIWRWTTPSRAFVFLKARW